MSITATAADLVKEMSLLPDVATSTVSSAEEVEVNSSSGASIILSRQRAPAGVFELWEVTDRTITDVPRRRQGFAKTADGRWFYLNDPESFAAFFRTAGRRLVPADLARLLTRYQGHDQGIDVPQNTIVSLADLQGALEPEAAAAIPGFTELRREPAGDREALTFCTFFISRDSPDRVFRVGLNLWQASWDREGQFQLRITPLARSLDSPRYRARRAEEPGVRYRSDNAGDN